MENKNIVKKSVLYLIGNFSSKILTSLLVPIYAFYVSTKTLGDYDYYMTIINIISPILFVTIWEAILKYILTEKDTEKNAVNSTTSALFTLCINIFILFIGIISLIVSKDNLYLFIALMMITSSLSQIWQSYCRAYKKNNTYVIASLLGTIVNLLLNIYLICYCKMEIDGLFISFILSQFTIFILIEIKIKIIKKIKIKYFDFKILKQMLVYSMPLVLNSIAMWLINGFGRMIIVNYLGSEVNGLYSFAYKFVNLISMLGLVISMALTEESLISLNKKQLGKEFAKTNNSIFIFFISIIMISMPALNIFYSFLNETAYYESLYMLPILLVYSVYMNMSNNLGIAFKVLDETKYQFTTTLMGSLSTVVISFALIDVLNVYAVLVGQAIGAFIMFISRYFYINKYTKFNLQLLYTSILLLIFFITSTILFNAGLIINIVFLIVFVLFSIYINRSLIYSILKS